MSLSDRQMDRIIESQRIEEKCGSYYSKSIKKSWCPNCGQKEIVSNDNKEQLECLRCDYTLSYEAEYFTPFAVYEYEDYQKKMTHM